MKTVYKYVLLLFFLIAFYACPEQTYEDGFFHFYNNSESDVCIYLGVAPRERGGSLYPDTMLMNINATVGPIKKGSSLYYEFYRSLSTDTLCLFIVDADTIKKYSWEEIKSGYKILKRYDLIVTLKELRRLNFEVSYPPTEAMKEIHMYPPYDE